MTSVEADVRHFLRAHYESEDIVIYQSTEKALKRLENWPSALFQLGIRAAELDEPGLQAVFVSESDPDVIAENTGWSADLFRKTRELAEHEGRDFVIELDGEIVSEGFKRLVIASSEVGAPFRLATAVRVTEGGDVVFEKSDQGTTAGECVVRGSELPVWKGLDRADVLAPEFGVVFRP